MTDFIAALADLILPELVGGYAPEYVDNNDFLMRDPNTGKELKRISTGKNAEGFAGSRPNGKDGKIYIHSYTDAYCIKAWGK